MAVTDYDVVVGLKVGLPRERFQAFDKILEAEAGAHAAIRRDRPDLVGSLAIQYVPAEE